MSGEQAMPSVRYQAFFDNLSDIKVVFDRARILFWLDFGTLLGAVREGTFIEWDNDIDLGTMSDNWDIILRTIPQLQNKGFCAFSSFLRIQGTLFYRKISFERYGIGIEITLYQNVGKNFKSFDMVRKHGYTGPSRLSQIFSRITKASYVALLMIFTSNMRFHQPLTIDQKYKINAVKRDRLTSNIKTTFKLIGLASQSVPKWAKFPGFVCRLGRVADIEFILYVTPTPFFIRLKSMRFLGLVFNVPSDVEKYLNYHYGNWRKPKKDWDWAIEDGSINGYVQQDIAGSNC